MKSYFPMEFRRDGLVQSSHQSSIDFPTSPWISRIIHLAAPYQEPKPCFRAWSRVADLLDSTWSGLWSEWAGGLVVVEETKQKKQDSTFSQLRVFDFPFQSCTRHFQRIHYTLPHLDATHRIITGNDGLNFWARVTNSYSIKLFCTTQLLGVWHSL